MNSDLIKQAAPKVMAALDGLNQAEQQYLLRFLSRNLDRVGYLDQDLADKEAQINAVNNMNPADPRFTGSMKVTRANGSTEEVKIGDGSV